MFLSDIYYKIPYRSLLPKEYDNMLVAGRCLSADRFALAAVRVMPPCFAMGEAVGVTAALAVDGDVNAVDVKRVQEILIQNNGYLD